MYILGIHNANDSGVCLIKNNKVLESISEERINRKKMYSGFPHLSLNLILKKYKIPLKKIDFFAYGWCGKLNKITDYNLRYCKRMEEEVKRNKNNLKLIKERTETEASRDNFVRQKFDEECDKLKIPKKKIIYIDHHQSHAWSAFSCSPFSKSLIFTLDARGDLRSGLVAYADIKSGIVEKDYLVSAFDGLGFLYGQITDYLGFTPQKHEGKVTGLAAFGNHKKTIKIFKNIIEFKNGKIKCKLGDYRPFFTNMSKPLKRKLSKHKAKDIAAGLQKHCEDIIIQWIKFWLKKTKSPQNICLAGGVFGNVKFNQKVAEIKGVKNMYVFPHMADGGIPYGSAALASFQKTGRAKITFKDMYSGSKFNSTEILRELRKNKKKILFKRLSNKSKFVAEKLLENKIIGIFNGRMEYGPRALGNRSIIANARDKKINDWLNKRLNRTEFMPFAPVTPSEFANKCYKNWKINHVASKFMTRTYDCFKEFALNHPAVVHIDGTARPQIISRTDNKEYYDMIKKFCSLSGDLSLINTSFNLHEEPIVHTPNDAIKALLRNAIDILIIGNFVVQLKNKFK